MNSQIDALKASLDKLSGEMGEMSQMAAQHFDELHDAVNNVASHTLAMEAIIAAMLANIEIDQQAVTNWIRAKTAEFSSPEHGESAAETIARDFLANN
ncbi:hypothetical protein [Thalassospira marina]|uniref:Uncharacterized protein n=1 Tax=Thalassospira marina TaxID=2048283 RepID=A0A2N3KUH6_9PROT|nr:hypothetical protein [Thalassospira marina]AUG55183.1 hypothetical protein CSC3H3_16980 [Thalassospira marina]PKR54221.1 hypothetical protein COO20_11420 [Thalassospira marina]